MCLRGIQTLSPELGFAFLGGNTGDDELVFVIDGCLLTLTC